MTDTVNHRLCIPLGLRDSPTEQLPQPADGSCIGPGVRFEGTFYTGVGCAVHGHLQGAVLQLPDHSCGLVVHEGATTEAFVDADTVEIHGNFKGQIENPRGKVIVYKTGTLLGEVRAGDLIVVSGVIDACIGVSPGGQ